MATSRCPLEFMKRKNIVPTYRPGMRFAPCALLVHQYPTGQTPEKDCIAEGDPPPDRSAIYPWAPHS